MAQTRYRLMKVTVSRDFDPVSLNKTSYLACIASFTATTVEEMTLGTSPQRYFQIGALYPGLSRITATCSPGRRWEPSALKRACHEICYPYFSCFKPIWAPDEYFRFLFWVRQDIQFFLETPRCASHRRVKKTKYLKKTTECIIPRSSPVSITPQSQNHRLSWMRRFDLLSLTIWLRSVTKFSNFVIDHSAKSKRGQKSCVLSCPLKHNARTRPCPFSGLVSR